MKFHNIDSNMILCDNCLKEWKEQSASGELVGDELYSPEKVFGIAETPAQCDGCLLQSDDYDDVLEDE